MTEVQLVAMQEKEFEREKSILIRNMTAFLSYLEQKKLGYPENFDFLKVM